MNVLHGLSLLALGRPSLTPTMVERMSDEVSGFLEPLARPAPKSAAARARRHWRAGLPDLPEDIGRQARRAAPARRHALSGSMPPSVPTEPGFSSATTTGCGSSAIRAGRRRSNAAWLMSSVWPARLPRSRADARRADHVGGAGAGDARFPASTPGAGSAASSSAWSTLVMEMLATDHATAAASYLNG